MKHSVLSNHFRYIFSIENLRFNDYLRMLFLSIILFYTSIGSVKADCTLPTGVTNIANVGSVCGMLPNTVSGILTIPNGATLNISSTTTFPAGFSQINVLNGGSIEVNVNYTFPSTLLKINLFDSDLAGPLPSGRINVDNSNSILTFQNNTQLIIQNTVTQLGFNTGAAITVQAMNGNCGQSVLIYLGSTPYAGCNNAQGAQVCFSFNDVIAAGGTPLVNPIITINGVTDASGYGVACAGSDFGLNATLGSNTSYVPQSYTWSQMSPASPLATITNGNTDSPTVNAATPETYVFKVTATIQVTGGNCGASSTLIISVTADITIIVRSAPGAMLAVTGTPACINSTAPVVTITNTTNLDEQVTYKITDTAGNTSTVTATILALGTTSINVPTNIAGTYTYELLSAYYSTPSACHAALSGSGTATIQNTDVVISGSIVKDITPTDGLVNGTLVTAANGYVSLVNNGSIVATVPVSGGTFTLPGVCEGTYEVVLHNTASGSLVPQLINCCSVYTSEGPLNGASAGTPDGKITVTIAGGLASYSKIAATIDASFGFSNTVLPVRLVSFEGKSTERGNLLNWKSAIETGFSHYEIERSSSAQSFERIGRVNGSTTNSKETFYYQFLDELPNQLAKADKAIPHNIYYRLKMVDHDGAVEYSKVVYLAADANNATVGKFYPNPAQGDITQVQIISNERKEWIITSFDRLGKLLAEEVRILDKGENILKIKLSPNTQGIQFFRFNSKNESFIRKLIY